ncbi:MAG: putative lipid II flippase FtsW [Nitrospiria bacterium]
MKRRGSRSRRLKNSMQIVLPFGPGGIVRNKEKRHPPPPLPSGDWVLLTTVVVLCLFGLLMVYNASSIRAERTYLDSFYFIKKQIQWSLVGVAAFAAASRFDADRLRDWMVPIAVLVMMALASALIFGKDINGSRRWISLGPISLQPSEIAKLFTVFYLSHYIAKKGERLRNFLDGAAPPLIVIGLMIFLILLEPDLGTTVVILCLSSALLFLGGVPLKQMAMLSGMLVPVFLYWAVSAPYRLKRLLTFLNPWKDPYGSGFQIIQSHIALGSGGLAGKGLTEGKQIMFFLPEPYTDFIFAVIGETFGLVGTTLILSLFAVILWRGTRIALKTESPFSRMMASGMTLLIVLPALLNMAVVTALLPTTGLPLPFLSYGGSAMLINCTAVGVLYNISRQVQDRTFGYATKGNSIWEGLQ